MHRPHALAQPLRQCVIVRYGVLLRVTIWPMCFSWGILQLLGIIDMSIESPTGLKK